MKTVSVGLIGIGELGTAVAGSIQKAGHPLIVYDANPAALARMADRGVKTAASAADVASQVDVLLTVLPTPSIVQDVLIGSGGALAAMRPGSVWIDHSTNDREVLLSIASQAKTRQIDVIEAPVTGGIPLAHAGQITVLVGADDRTFARYRPLLEAVGEPVIHVGEVGSATVVKLITNMLAFCHLWALGEGLMIGRAAGLAVGSVFEAIKASCGSSFVAETEGPPILDGSYDYGFTMALAAKDMHLAMKLAEELGVPLRMGALVDKLLGEGIEKYGRSFWSTGLVKLLEDEVGLDLRAEGYAPADRWLAYSR